MAKLDGLHGDIVIIILDVLEGINRPRRLFLKDLRSLSLTSRSLRTTCLPILFRSLKQVWGKGLYKTVPNSLCSYVLIFELDMSAVDLYSLDGIGSPDELTVSLPKVLPQMRFLHTFKLTNALFLGAWPSLLRTVFGLPHIHTLEIRDSVWRVPEERFTNADLMALAADDDDSHLRPSLMPEIRQFIYRAPFTDCFPLGSKSYGRRDTIQGTVEVSNLIVLIELFRPSLEVLELPAELAPRVIHEVANSFSGPESKPLFPNLREFCAQGYIPLSGGAYSSSQHPSNSIQCLEGFFGLDSLDSGSDYNSVWAPRLQQLRLCLAATSEHSPDSNHGNARVAARASDREHQNQYPYGGPTELRFLSLSTPVSDDTVFCYLPENLIELDLRAYPLPGVLGRSSDKSISIHTTVPSARELTVVFGNIGGERLRLRILKISYTAGDADAGDGSRGDQGCEEERLFACLMKTFSEVEVLEVHRFEAGTRARTEIDEIDVSDDEAVPQALTRHLSSSRHLKNISLNLDNGSLDLPTLHRSRISWAHDDDDEVTAEQRRIDREIRTAKTVAEKIKSLSTIRTMSHEGFSSHWNIWEIVRRDTVEPQTSWSTSDNSEPIVELLNQGRCEV
ncbi:hypothetical protein L218DRAFT_606809 [Marasmius fiardii PR-910]|nr:hypothetical protein L218DRAFT_606809 [Marasmius fiardii PR-910]